MKAVIAYKKKLSSSTQVPKTSKLNQEMEMKRETIVRSFSIAKNMYCSGEGMTAGHESELEVGAEFLEVS